MPESNFGSLGERLLRAGIAPAHVRRLVAELELHYASLVEEELASGQPLAAARSAAHRRLGTDDDIVARTCEQTSLRSWGARWPLAICGLAPLLGLIASAALLVASLVMVVSLAGTRSDPGSWMTGGATLIGWSMMYGLPLLWACLLVRYAITRRLSPLWALTGLFLTAACGAMTNFTAAWPHAGAGGQLSAGFGWTAQGAMSAGIRCVITFALGISLYRLMRARLERRTAA